MKVNIYMGKEMVKEKNIIKLEEQNMKENMYMTKNRMEIDIILIMIY